ncbi:T9SS type A sorting domain-containing protein [Flavobacterium cheniae]|uniref:Putative secreted protein (Por secretion system target) n=1 Tax=Flavobacterium cheniae TaxID=295428 RepID=A0A562KRQ5_9FLAO|nr:T9SS type A sorting domain-containing protein [Flavobacterium cheniae]TDR25725.1 putative secreted protein (Por secretion system target) [Flavobacterium cheniae]TWH98090.1 putative secreted protein (Por secretion system target) [Flavobacterium cheniae]
MKKTLLLFSFFTLFNLQGQIVLNAPGPITYTATQFGQLYTDNELQGTLTAVALQATLTATLADTYANDLAIYVTPTSTLALNGLLQAGGFSNLGATERHQWASGNSSTLGTVLNSTYTLLTPLDFTTNPTYNVWLGNAYSGAGASGTWTNLTITLTGVSETPASNDDFVSSTFNVYPNPSSSLVTISGNNMPIRKIGIIDINGRAIRTEIPSIASNEMTLDISSLNTGVYFLVIDTEQGNAVKKLVKN